MLPLEPKRGVSARNLHTETPPNFNWFAVYTRSHFEKKMYNALSRLPYKVFLPQIKEHRIWSDRVKKVIVPLIPGYVFIQIPRNKLSILYGYPGFVKIVSSAGIPCPIREEDIKLMERIMNHDIPVEKVFSYQTGDKVLVTRGPFKGREGRVQHVKGSSRVIFQISSIQQNLSVEINMNDVEKIKSTK